MSQILINKYLTELANLKKVSGTNRESVVREAFKDLLKSWGRALDLTFVPEYEVESKTKQRRYVDGALLHTLRVPFGYWEAKDSDDDLDAEIASKFRAGYPKSNILFEDSTQAVLIQQGDEVMRCGVDDVANLEKLLKLFFGYERPEIEAFRKAVAQFKADLPAVLEALRAMIETAERSVPKFRAAVEDFLRHAQEAINPNLVAADVREMLIQHILTGEVFSAVFPGTTYHEDNSIARELFKLETTFFTGNTKHQTLKGLAPYYAAIRKAASDIDTHHEKQTFLKSIYENFYKVYNPKAADRLGVVYTPNEIVRFMIEGADWLCEQHFKKSLIDNGVDILDPATGTGTFICELIEHFAGQPSKLKQKYRKELHANEVAILPYYVANLNIEATYAASTDGYEEFPGLCFVDTLDNTHALRKHAGYMEDIFGGVSDDNVKRIRQQNSRRISVIIGNPPYNANQLNENENNKNREYPEIDKRIKDTYIRESTAQKTKVYDMYARFFRWASDRLDENGVLALITNRSFLDSRTFDGFRTVVTKEFNEIRIVDLGGDVRANPKLSGTVNNVFGIQTGVAISFCVKRSKAKGCRIYYARRPEMETAEEKLSFLNSTKASSIEFDVVTPDSNNNWLGLEDTDFQSLVPLCDGPRSIFRSRTNGVNTARDEWVYDFSEETLLAKSEFLVDEYNHEHRRFAKGAVPRSELSKKIKWSEGLLNKVKRIAAKPPTPKSFITANYRPFVSMSYFRDPIFSDRLTSLHSAIFGASLQEIAPCIAVSAPSLSRPFHNLASSRLADWHYVGDTQLYALNVVSETGSVANITDWSQKEFRRRYQPGNSRGARPITKVAIFHYVYGVLHDPTYRQKYAQNLRRDFPRIPFYKDFWQWSDWGKVLMELHVGYEKAAPFKLKRVDVHDEKARGAGQSPKALLRADKDKGIIVLDKETTLLGIPSEAWDYRLGSRSALEWVLDQYKEYTSRDPIVREKFNEYRFADYKEEVIDLLSRVTQVSLETVKVVNLMNHSTH